MRGMEPGVHGRGREFGPGGRGGMFGPGRGRGRGRGGREGDFPRNDVGQPESFPVGGGPPGAMER